jgi:hypothetical protein
MKKLILLICLFVTTNTLFAQAPQGVNYQAVVRNSAGVAVETQSVSIRFTVLQNSVNGTAVYAETHAAITNSLGLVNLVIGQGSATQGSFNNIDWATGPYFIQTEVDVAGGSNYVVAGTQQLMSVPYALHAQTAESLVGGGSGTNGFSHYIGEQFGGGVIFHLWLDSLGVEHGLIVDYVDLALSQVWSNVNSTLIGPSAQSSWDGLSNSNAIVNQAGHTNSAAALCLNSNNSGQNDWYLPALDEVFLLSINRFNVNKTLSTIPGTSELRIEAEYWSSTENDIDRAWLFLLNSINSVTNSKARNESVRAIRAF